jgi:type III pantothenate kinase
MNLVIDNGNSRTKLATFDDGGEWTPSIFDSAAAVDEFLASRSFHDVLVSSVKRPPEEILSLIHASGRKLVLTPTMSLPFRVTYRTPQTLGVDRIAAVAGASALFPGQDCLVIDAGTCITYEFLTADGNYRGGSISPGIRMRFEAMNKFTARLPLAGPIKAAALVGATTEESLQSGVMIGVEEEIKGMITRYEAQAPELQVLMCGGDASFFENIRKPSIFVAPDLVLHGLRRILMHHVA